MARFGTLAAGALLVFHLSLAESSLVLENPTVDEVVHLPAGVSYWQKGTFRLYHHNPPLIKMVAALPVVLARPVTNPVYMLPSWRANEPSPTTFSQSFAFLNIERYFELFGLARMVMPLFSVLGGMVVYAWSRRLYGELGGLLSLALWVFCPNILAHGRLITTDVGATAMGVAATYVFWLTNRGPSWRRSVGTGLMLGLAQLSKFSMLLLVAVWPFVWLVRVVLTQPRSAWPRIAARGGLHGALTCLVALVVVDSFYLFEGVGRPLGRFEFASRSLTGPVPGGIRTAPATKNPAYERIWPFRQNRFRGTLLEHLPVPLPEHYILGFDEQKFEAEGVPHNLQRAYDALRTGDMSKVRLELASQDVGVDGYPVYLNGVIRRTGWWHFYLDTLLYKVPEGTWMLVVLSLGLLMFTRKSAGQVADEITLATIPAVILFSMSFLTDINLGLRYILPIAPYVYIACGKIAPWIEGGSARLKWLGRSYVLASLGLTVAATATIHPSYLGYFNWTWGGPDREPARLIDSNLDWGQDLVRLREWCRRKGVDRPIGLAYFGQINPSIFTLRNDRFDWFLPPGRPGSVRMVDFDPRMPKPRLNGPARSLEPGLYAISASLVHGLPWRLYDGAQNFPDAWAPTWNAWDIDAFGYFRHFPPKARIGHSILIYELSQKDIDRVGPALEPPRP